MYEKNEKHARQRTKETTNDQIAPRLVPVSRPAQDAIANYSAHGIAHNTSKKYSGGEESRVFQVEPVAMKKK
jgi:hypothetical protein